MSCTAQAFLQSRIRFCSCPATHADADSDARQFLAEKFEHASHEHAHDKQWQWARLKRQTFVDLGDVPLGLDRSWAGRTRSGGGCGRGWCFGWCFAGFSKQPFDCCFMARIQSTKSVYSRSHSRCREIKTRDMIPERT
jgi:hypothetical protein